MNLGRLLISASIFRVLNLLVLFVVNIFLTRMAGVAGYGIFSLILANATILNMILSFGVDASITYNLSSKRIQFKKIYSIVLTLILLQLVITTLVEYIAFAVSGKSWVGQSINPEHLYLGVLYLLSLSLIDKYSSLYYGKQLFNLCNISLLAGNVLILAVLSFLFFQQEDQTNDLLKLFIFLQAAAAIIHLAIFHIRTKEAPAISFPDRTELKRFFHYSGLAFLINILQFISYRMDYWLLDYYSPDGELGWYSLAVRITQLFWILPTLFAGILLPKIADITKKFSIEKFLSLVRITNATAFIGITIMFIVSDWIIPFFFGEEYSYSSQLIKILIPGIFMFCTAGLIAVYYAGKGKLLVNLWGTLLTLALILILDLLLIPKYAGSGAAIASTISYSVTTLYYIFIFCRDNKLSLPQIFIPNKDDWRQGTRIFQVKTGNKSS